MLRRALLKSAVVGLCSLVGLKAKASQKTLPNLYIDKEVFNEVKNLDDKWYAKVCCINRYYLPKQLGRIVFQHMEVEIVDCFPKIGEKCYLSKGGRFTNKVEDSICYLEECRFTSERYQKLNTTYSYSRTSL